MKKILIFLLLNITTWVSAQIYPVQVIPQLVPPYSLKLSDYQTTSSEKLYVNLLLTDINESNRRVRLKMFIEGQGIEIQSTDFVTTAAPIFLDGGVNLRLSNLDLKTYFELNNLQGISPQQYSQPLPDGLYQFCFQVFDYLTGQELSDKSCTSVYLILNDPPILNLPNRGDKIVVSNPQNIIFSWTPRHLNATGVQYEFTLKEQWDNQMNPQAAFLASPPLYQTTTFTTMLHYGPTEPALLPGKIYSWQVKALVSDGISETSVFRNNGYSEIYHFEALAPCEAPSFIISQAEDAQSVKISWQFSNHIRYQVQYRKKGSEGDWFTANAYTQEIILHNLEPGTVYEFKVGGECVANGGYTFSNIYECTTPTEAQTAFYNCGIPPSLNTLNQTPLPELSKNDHFVAGDFPITVIETSGSNGTFTGMGYITLPFIEKFSKVINAVTNATNGDVNPSKYTRIKVKFDNVKINTDYKLTDGMVVTDYDPNWGGILDVDAALDVVNGESGEIKSFDATNINIDSIKVNTETGKIILVDNNGVEHPIEATKPVVINGAKNEQWTVDKDGKVTGPETLAPGGKPTATNTDGVDSNGNVTSLTATDVSITFAAAAQYTTDTQNEEIKDTKYTKKYDKIKKADGTDYLPLYAVVGNQPATLTATCTFSNGTTSNDVVFKTKQGTLVTATWANNVATITHNNKFNFALEELIATIKPKDTAKGKYSVAGKVNLWHLKQKSINVTLVPINGATISSSLATELNEIYNKVSIQLNTQVASNLSLTPADWNDDGDGKLDVGNSDLLSYYTAEEQAIISKFGNTQKDQYYIFVAPMATSKNLGGFMPLKGQFGFVFTANTTNQTRTIAHEMGHGVFGLKHPFDQYEVAENKTDYLMDYGTGTNFSQLDWQVIHSPGLQLYWFQSNEAGELASGYGLTPDFKYVKTNTYTTSIYNNTPQGFLDGFIYVDTENNNTEETYKWDTTDKKYYKYDNSTKSYVLNGTLKIVFKDTPKATLQASDIVYLIYDKQLECPNIKYLRTLYSNISNIKTEAALTNYIDLNKNKKTKDVYSNTIDCSGNSNNGTVNPDEIKIVYDCGKDAFIQKSLVTFNNAQKTWGEVVVGFLDDAIKTNSKNKYGNNLNNVSLGGLHYINPSVRYNGNKIFEPKYIEELNNKLAYLEVSSGVQLYVNFMENSCSFTQVEGDKFASDIFQNSQISKENGIYVLVTRNLKTQGKYEWNTFFKFGSGVSAAVKTAAESLLYIAEDNKFDEFGQKIIQFYKEVPKKQMQYIYEIEIATEQEKNSGDYEYKFLTKNINGKVVTLENQKGNAVKAKFYFKNNQLNKTFELNETSNVKELKEEYVAEQIKNLAFIYAEKFAGWKFECKDIDVNNPTGIKRYKVFILDCKFTLNKTCTQESIDTAFLVAGIASIPFGNVAVVVDGLSVIYYASTGQTDMAMMYLAGYGLGATLPTIFKGIANVSKNGLKFFNNLYATSRFSKFVNNTAKTDAKVLEFLGKPVSQTNHEYMILDATLNNGFIKVEQNQILAGYVKVVDNANELYILELKTGNHALSNKFANATAEELEAVFKGVKGAGSLSDYVSALLNKNIRNAILDLAESKVVAQKYFDKIKLNPNDFPTGYTIHLDDFDQWYTNVFKSELFEAHHIIPKNILNNNPKLQQILDWARQNNKTWDFGGIDNGIMLQKRSKNSIGEIVGDHANHPQYDLKIRDEIEEIFNLSNGNISKAYDDLVDFVEDLKVKLNSDVVQGNFIVNNVNMP